MEMAEPKAPRLWKSGDMDGFGRFWLVEVWKMGASQFMAVSTEYDDSPVDFRDQQTPENKAKRELKGLNIWL